MKRIDTRGLSCPEPVLRVREALDSPGAPGSLDVLVDTATARENVCRVARSMGYGAEIEELEGDILIRISRIGG